MTLRLCDMYVYGNYFTFILYVNVAGRVDRLRLFENPLVGSDQRFGGSGPKM